MSHNLGYINEVASQSGRPEWNFLIPLCWSLPNNGRILIFLLFGLDAIFVYEIVKDSGLFDKRGALMIALLFSIIPVNDARLLISNFPYSVGLFMFFLSFMLFVKWNNGKKEVWQRMVILFCFFFSFILNSVLAYYYIIIAYLWVLDIKKSDEKNIIKRILVSVKNVLLGYPDFFVIPFVYYFSNKILFPTYGPVFGNYNSVSIGGLLKCLIYIPLSMLKGFYNSFSVWGSALLFPLAAILIVLIVLYIVFDKKGHYIDNEVKTRDILLMVLYGGFVLFMGLFPYVTVRGRTLVMTGVRGRDAILTPLGTAIVLFSIFELLKGKYKRVLYSIVIIAGIFGCNSLYLEWQRDSYYQRALENLMRDPVIANNDTFFLIDINETWIDAQRYYSLNANASNVYGDESRLFIPTVSNLYFLRDEKSMKEVITVLDYAHVMRDYDPDDYFFDAVLNYNCSMSDEEVLSLKRLEIFDKTAFDNKIKEYGTLDIYVVDDDFTIQMFDKYDNGELRGDQDVLNYLMEYAK